MNSTFYLVSLVLSVFSELAPWGEVPLPWRHSGTIQRLDKMCASLYFTRALRFKSKANGRVLTSNRSSSFNGLLDLFLVVPAEVRQPSNVVSWLSCCPLPEARKVVPMGDLPIKHGGLQDKKQRGKVHCHKMLNQWRKGASDVNSEIMQQGIGQMNMKLRRNIFLGVKHEYCWPSEVNSISFIYDISKQTNVISRLLRRNCSIRNDDSNLCLRFAQVANSLLVCLTKAKPTL